MGAIQDPNKMACTDGSDTDDNNNTCAPHNNQQHSPWEKTVPAWLVLKVCVQGI